MTQVIKERANIFLGGGKVIDFSDVGALVGISLNFGW
jgi:hypothetical protein